MVVDKRFGAFLRRQVERQRVISGNDGSTETIRNAHATHVLRCGTKLHGWNRHPAGRGRGTGWLQLASPDHSQFIGAGIGHNR